MKASKGQYFKSISTYFVLIIVLLCGCYVVPETGRQSLVLIDEATEIRLGLEAFNQARTETPISRNAKLNNRVQKVGTRISSVANQPNYQWEFTVFDASDTVNAWCLPGGKIGIYTGLFKVVNNEDQLAFVTAHEVGHAVAKHGAERMSHQLLLAAGAEVIAATMDDETAEDREKVERMRVAYGIGSTLFIMLPFSRKHEYEADRIGLMYMADAGYNPKEAIKLQESFIEYHRQKGNAVPDYLSTHPSDDKRLAQMKSLMPEAMRRYYRATGQTPIDTGDISNIENSSEDMPSAKIQKGKASNKKSFTGVRMEGD